MISIWKNHFQSLDIDNYVREKCDISSLDDKF